MLHQCSQFIYRNMKVYSVKHNNVTPIIDKEQHKETVEDVDNVKGSFLGNIRPVLLTMRLCGFSYGDTCTVKRAFLFTYCALVLVILLLAEVRICYVSVLIEDPSLSNPSFTITVVGIIWFGLGLANAMIVFGLEARGRVGRMCETIERIAASDSKLKSTKMKCTMKIIMAAFWAFLIVNTIVFVVISVNSDVFKYLMLHPADTDLTPLTIAIYCTYWFATSAWLIPLFFGGIVMITVSTLFKEHQKALENDLEKLTETKLEISRQKFNDLCDAVTEADVICAPLNGVNYTLNVAVVLLLLYSGIFTDPDSLGGLSMDTWVLVLTIWIVTNCIYLAVPTIVGATLNSNARSFTSKYFLPNNIE